MTYGHLGRFTPWEEIWQAIEQLVRKGQISSSALIWPRGRPEQGFDLEQPRKQAAACYQAMSSGAIKDPAATPTHHGETSNERNRNDRNE